MNTRLIAEIGINHNGDPDIARKLINVAACAGYTYVKFQKRNPDVCVPKEQKKKKRQTPWGEMTYLDYKYRIEFNESTYRDLFDYARSRHITPFASVWDVDSAKFMQQLTDIVKVPSALIHNHDLLRVCRSNFKYTMISTGMSTEKEIEEAVDIICPDVIFHTNSAYPCPVHELNLEYIRHLDSKYSADIGFSSHYSIGIQPIVWSIFFGAKIVEVHVTLDRGMWGSDQASSIGLTGLFKLPATLRDAEAAIGSGGPRELFASEIPKRRTLRGV